MLGATMMLPFLTIIFLHSSATPERQAGVPIGKGTHRATVHLTAPEGGWSVDRMLKVEGTVSDFTIDPVTLSINGDRYLVRTLRGQFSRTFPAASGKNVVTVMATNRGGTATEQASVYAQIPTVPMKVILTSDTDGVYTDLHIYEPGDGTTGTAKIDAAKMQHVFWAKTTSPTGGTFFLNAQGGDFDQPGYGPYLYIHRAPPKGVYLVATNYWPSGDKAHTVATLNVVLNEGTPQESRRTVHIPLATPGTTRALAWINLRTDGQSEIYIPSSDSTPDPLFWPSNLSEVVSKLGANPDDTFGDL